MKANLQRLVAYLTGTIAMLVVAASAASALTYAALHRSETLLNLATSTLSGVGMAVGGCLGSALILRFKAARVGGEGESEVDFFLASVISRAEKETLQSFRDLLDFSAKTAAQSLRGIFGLGVLSADLGDGIRRFNPKDFAALLTNHARKLENGAKVLVRYGQVFSVLHRRAPADWGKIDVTDPVELLDPEAVRAVSFLKKMTRAAAPAGPAVFLLHDLGAKPVWDMNEELREKSLAAFLAQNPSSSYYYRQGGKSRPVG